MWQHERRMLRKIVAFTLILAGVSFAQYQRRSSSKANPAPPTSAVSPTFEGTLKSMTGKEILLQLATDQVVSIRRNHKTKFVENGKDVKPDNIKQGTPLAIDVKEDIDLKPIALRVVVNPPPPKSEQ